MNNLAWGQDSSLQWNRSFLILQKGCMFQVWQGIRVWRVEQACQRCKYNSGHDRYPPTNSLCMASLASLGIFHNSPHEANSGAVCWGKNNLVGIGMKNTILILDSQSLQVLQTIESPSIVTSIAWYKLFFLYLLCFSLFLIQVFELPTDRSVRRIFI